MKQFCGSLVFWLAFIGSFVVSIILIVLIYENDYILTTYTFINQNNPREYYFCDTVQQNCIQTTNATCNSSLELIK